MRSTDKKRVQERTILSADRVGDRLVVTFDDGVSVSFEVDYLYQHRNDNGNVTVSESDISE